MLNDQDYELLSAYIDGALTPEERTALEARLLAETELREELEALRSTVALVKALPMRQAPRDFRLTRGMVQARRPAARRYVVTSTAISFISAAAAILLIGFSLVLLSGKQANAPQTSSSVALAMTDTTGFAEYNAAQKTASQTAESPLENEASATLLEEAQRQSTEETFGQAAGGADAAAGDQQTQTQPQAPVTAPLNDGLTDIALPTGTITDADAMMFAAPAASDLLEPSASASDFYYDGEAANGAVAQQPMPTAAAVPAQTQAQEAVPPADTASSALAQAASPTAQPTQTPPPTATVTPSSTPSATMTPTVTPTVTATVTATATATLVPTLTMTPVPSASTSAKPIDAPVIMLVAGLLLLAVSGIFYVRSRRQV